MWCGRVLLCDVLWPCGDLSCGVVMRCLAVRCGLVITCHVVWSCVVVMRCVVYRGDAPVCAHSWEVSLENDRRAG